MTEKFHFFQHLLELFVFLVCVINTAHSEQWANRVLHIYNEEDLTRTIEIILLSFFFKKN